MNGKANPKVVDLRRIMKFRQQRLVADAGTETAAAEMDTDELLRCSRDGDLRASDTLFAGHREHLKRMVRLCFDPRLRGRLDVSDVIQEVHLEAFRHLPDFPLAGNSSFFLWMRSLTCQKPIDIHRHHLGANARNPRRELRLPASSFPEAGTSVLAAELVAKRSTPGGEVPRAEILAGVERAFEGLGPTDREVLVLRHFEQPSNAETAMELDLRETATGQRYVRALGKLRQVLSPSIGEFGESWKIHRD